MAQPFIHTNTTLSDKDLEKEAAAFLLKSPALQAMAQILEKQRFILLASGKENSERQLGWLTLAEFRKAFPAADRMKALEPRPDIRQRVTTQLTGLREKAARNKSAEFQAELIDSAIDDGDIQLADFETAFDPKDLVIYMDAALFWKHLMSDSVARIIEENTAREKEFFAFLLDVFLQDRPSLKPILTHLDVRSAILGETWQQRIPLEKRVAVDKMRLQQERKDSRRPFTAKQELAIVTLQVMVESLDLEDLVPILKAAGEAMEFQRPEEDPGVDGLFIPDNLSEPAGKQTSDQTAQPDQSSPGSGGAKESAKKA